MSIEKQQCFVQIVQSTVVIDTGIKQHFELLQEIDTMYIMLSSICGLGFQPAGCDR